MKQRVYLHQVAVRRPLSGNPTEWKTLWVVGGSHSLLHARREVRQWLKFSRKRHGNDWMAFRVVGINMYSH